MNITKRFKLMGGPIYNDKAKVVFFLACLDKFSKLPSDEACEKATGTNNLKFLTNYL